MKDSALGADMINLTLTQVKLHMNLFPFHILTQFIHKEKFETLSWVVFMLLQLSRDFPGSAQRPVAMLFLLTPWWLFSNRAVTIRCFKGLYLILLD